MLHKAVQVRLYPSQDQQIQLAQTFGCARWWWNYSLNKSIEIYKETGKGLGRSPLNALLPSLNKAEQTKWLADLLQPGFTGNNTQSDHSIQELF